MVVVGRIIALQDVHTLILGHCECSVPPDTAEGLRGYDWGYGPWDGKVILEYPGGPKIIAGFLKIWEPSPLAEKQGDGRMRGPDLPTRSCSGDGFGAVSKGRGWPWEPRKGKQADAPSEPPEGPQSCSLHDLSPGDPFWMSDLHNSNIVKFVLFNKLPSRW